MSISGTRAAFKAALDTVVDVAGHVSKPTVPKPGDAWPILGTGERDETAGLFVWAWNVAVYLPQDRAAADNWIDEHIDALVQAIWVANIGLVDEVSPANFGNDSNYIYGLLLALRSD